MAQRKQLKGIASGIVGSFVSRNNDVDGYWGIGKLCLAAKEIGQTSIVVDIFPPPDLGVSVDDVLAKVARHYDSMMKAHLQRARIDSSRVKCARIVLEFGASEPLRAPPMDTWGEPFICRVEIIDDLGRTWTVSRTGRCASHDPRREQRSARVSAT